MSRKMKIKIFRTAVEPVLLYGSETWTMNKSDIRRLDGVYARMLRRVLGKRNEKHLVLTIPSATLVENASLVLTRYIFNTASGFHLGSTLPKCHIIHIPRPHSPRKWGAEERCREGLFTNSALISDLCIPVSIWHNKSQLARVKCSSPHASSPIDASHWRQCIGNIAANCCEMTIHW